MGTVVSVESVLGQSRPTVGLNPEAVVDTAGAHVGTFHQSLNREWLESKSR